MKERQLVHALVKEELIHIDKLKNKKQDFLCPYCKQPVMPKQGEKNVWHFAHKGETCLESTKDLDDGKNKALAGFVTSTVSEIEVPEDPIYFQCCKCYKKERKEIGIKYSEKEYICRSCFKLL